jgi:hypothetical protein
MNARMSYISKSAVAQLPVLQVLRKKMSHKARSGRDRLRVVLVVVIIPCIVCASAARLARASFYRPQPILCDGIDDDSGISVVCGLLEDMAKKLAFNNLRALPGRALPFPEIIDRSLAQLRTRLRPSPGASLLSTRLRTQRAVRPEDPDDTH